MAEEIDENPEDTPGEETPPEETLGEPSVEPGTEPEGEGGEKITADKAYDLAKAVQKGYTLTRQDMAEIRDNQQRIQQALEEIRKSKADELGGDLEEEPLTVKKYLELETQRQQAREKADTAINQKIERQLAELRAQGTVTTEKEEEELLNFAVKHKITNLADAAAHWNEVKEAKKEGIKEGLKGKVKADAGSKIGTSQKAGTDREQGFDYGEITGKSMEELAEE